MQHYTSIDNVFLQDAWMTIGSFDGVHRGHQLIIEKVVSGARRASVPAVVVTFYPHPAVVLGKRQEAFYLNSPQERADLLGEMGVDAVITYTFTREVANLSAFEFMSQLHNHLMLRRLFVGSDFALGHGREGTTDLLADLGKTLGYELEVVPPVLNGDVVISSSLIRSWLAAGDVRRAASLLGRPYRISGEIIHGDGRGKALGIPTANLSVWTERTLPKAGVYVCRASIQGQTWGAVTNIGVRPTFESAPVPPRVEAHVLNFNRELYGQEMQLDFIDYLRDEQRFSSVQTLVDQIQADIHSAKEILDN